MNIGIIARDLSLKQGGGAYNFIKQSCLLLPELDDKNTYYAFVQTDVELESEIKKIRVPKAPKIIWDHLLVPLYAYKNGVDLIFSPKNTVPFFWFRKSVVSILDLAYFDLPKAYRGFESAYMRLMIRLSIMKSTIAVGISDYTVKRMKEVFKNVKSSKLRRIYLAHDQDFNSGSVHSKEVIAEKYDIKNTYVLFVGGIQPRKNLETLAKAMSLLWEEGMEIDLVVVGRKSVKHEEVLGNIESKTYDRINFTGYIDREDLLVLYKYALTYVYPSLYEGFGIPILEAMALGCPVIASDVTSLPEVVGDAGVIVSPKDYNAFSKYIRKMMEDKDWRENYIRKGESRVKEFSWEKCMEEYIKVFHNLDKIG